METNVLVALAEPNRLRIVELLRERPYSVNEVAQALKLRQPQASKHLHTLAKAGLVRVNPQAQLRIYTLQPEAFSQLNDWLKTFEHHWTKRLGDLDNYLEKLQEEK